MVNVTWGPNTVHPIGTPAPAPFGTPAPAPSTAPFGAPSPAPAPLAFGASSTSTFGTPAPAPGGGGLFGTPAPAPAGGGLFGSPTPAPAGGGFFGAPAPAPTTNLFGAPSPAPSGNLFGAPAPSSFGMSSTQQQQQQQQQIPAQAALQAHLDASARQEAERVRSALETLHVAYTGNALPKNGESSKFVTIVYNDLTPEQRQQQWIHGMGNGGMILAPPRPPQISESEWKKAVVSNPDPQNYMPVPLVGAVALQARVSWQQDRAKDLATSAVTLQKSHETVKDRSARTMQEIEQKLKRHTELRKKLLQVMKSVELARCMNQQIQPDEIKAAQRLQALLNEVDSVRGMLISLQDKARTQAAAASKGTQLLAMPDKEKLLPVLNEQRRKLETLSNISIRDSRDVRLISQRVAATVPVLRN